VLGVGDNPSAAFKNEVEFEFQNLSRVFQFKFEFKLGDLLK
jgi:hypothetical protein